MAENQWNISTDIYDIVASIEDIKKQQIDDQDEVTLTTGIFGYIGDIEAKKIQTSTILAGELGNEMFPMRANLMRNVLTHAIYANIHDINASPANITVNIGLKVSDFDKYVNEDNQFIFDHMSPLYIEEYEFHVDYDIIVTRYEANDGSGSYLYTARYDMTEINRISNITEPYLNQPFEIKIDNDDYIILQVLMRQCTIEETNTKLYSSSIIENKNIIFDINDGQLVDFDVYVTDNSINETTRLRPVLYNGEVEEGENYCWYLYINDDTIRITFDQKSYIPGLNSDVYIKAYTTLGTGGEFSYRKQDNFSEEFFIEMSSKRFDYSNITMYAVAISDSTNAVDKKSKEELQKLIPKAALSRGAFTTETDINNYFNLIDTENRRLFIKKKVDNNLSRVWYGFFLLKDMNGNIIPTNTINLAIDTSEAFCHKNEGDGRWVLPAGTVIKYNMESNIGYPIDEKDVPDIYDDDLYFGDYYYYMTVYNIIITADPLYCANYLTIQNSSSFFEYRWVNRESILQFVANLTYFKRNLLTDQNIYRFAFRIAQSIKDDYMMYIEETVYEDDENGNNIEDTIITVNMKCILVLYGEDDNPYRWIEVPFIKNCGGFVYEFGVDFVTDNGFDEDNKIKILNLMEYGSGTNKNYGYFPPNCKVVMYILGKFSTNYGRYDLDTVCPGQFEEYTVTNVYELHNGFQFYETFANVLDTRIEAGDYTKTKFNIYQVPVIGFHYMISEEMADYLLDSIEDRKQYIDYCLTLFENSIGVDFKFFNTYGPCWTYHNGSKEKELIGHIDIEMKFRLSIKANTDVYVKDEIIDYIKHYIENIESITNFHAPNMIAEITREFQDRINFIEFMNYNDFRLGVQHIIAFTEVELEGTDYIPEFINIRNRYNVDFNLEPCIDIELVTSY